MFEQDFSKYVKGDYDKLIEMSRERGVEPVIYVTFNEQVNFTSLVDVLDKATKDGLKIGYTFEGSDKVFDFISKHKCR